MPPYLRETEEKNCQESRIIVAYDATVWQEVEVCFFQLSARAIGRPHLSMFCQALIYLFGISFGKSSKEDFGLHSRLHDAGHQPADLPDNGSIC